MLSCWWCHAQIDLWRYEKEEKGKVKVTKNRLLFEKAQNTHFSKSENSTTHQDIA